MKKLRLLGDRAISKAQTPGFEYQRLGVELLRSLDVLAEMECPSVADILKKHGYIVEASTVETVIKYHKAMSVNWR